MSTDQLRGALSRSSKANEIHLRLEVLRMASQAAAAFSLFGTLEDVVDCADEDGPEVSAKLLAAAVQYEKGVNLALFMLQSLAEAENLPERKALFVAARTELLIAANKSGILQDEMRADLRDLDTPPGDE